MDKDAALIEKAISVALGAHKGQFDRSGKAYILHPLRVMGQFLDTDACLVGILHDVVEDSDLTFNDLLEQGFPARIVEAIKCLTHPKEEAWMDYIERIGQNPLATRVKLADLQDNLNLRRLGHLQEKDLDRYNRYLQAWKYLSDLKP
ncbi:HD domain-containing protein [Anaerolineales bacterium]